MLLLLLLLLCLYCCTLQFSVRRWLTSTGARWCHGVGGTGTRKQTLFAHEERIVELDAIVRERERETVCVWKQGSSKTRIMTTLENESNDLSKPFWKNRTVVSFRNPNKSAVINAIYVMFIDRIFHIIINKIICYKKKKKYLCRGCAACINNKGHTAFIPRATYL